MFLNRSFWPDVEATGQLLTELCEDIGEEFETIVIAGQPNENLDRANFKIFGSQRVGATQVKRVWHTKFAKRKILGRLTNQLSFMLGCLFLALFTRKVDIIVFQTDPPLLCFLGWILKLRHRCRLIAYLQDVYPDIALALEKVPDGTAYRFARRFFYAVYKRVDRVVVLSDDMHSLMAKSGIQTEKLRIVPNWIDAGRVYPDKTANNFRVEHGLDDQFVVMYSGNLGLSQRLDMVIEAAAQMHQHQDVIFAFIGDGASKLSLQAEVNRRGLSNVRFFPYQPKDQLATSLSAADLHIVPIDARVLQCLMPSKLYGVLASGTPALVIAPEFSELARIVQSEQVGITVPDAESISWAVQWAYQNRQALVEMGRRGRELAVAQYDRGCSTERFAAVLRELMWYAVKDVPATPSAKPMTAKETAFTSVVRCPLPNPMQESLR